MEDLLAKANSRSSATTGTVECPDGFSAVPRPLELINFAEGDIITLPAKKEDIKVFKAPIRNSNNSYEYINVRVTRGKDQFAIPLAPGMFYRRLPELNAEGAVKAWRVSSGTAVDEMQNSPKVQDFFVNNLGRQIEVRFSEMFPSRTFDGEAKDNHVPILNFKS